MIDCSRQEGKSLTAHLYARKMEGSVAGRKKRIFLKKPEHLTVPPKPVNFADLKCVVICMGKILDSFAEKTLEYFCVQHRRKKFFKNLD